MTASVAGAVAVVGLSCRLPGAAGPQEFWRVLREGREAITETPAERWALQGLSGLDEVPDGLRRGGFLEQVDRFDARFFGVAPREAAAMDPQQRLALELCWEALEDAGIVPGELSGSDTGVFVGAIAGDYAGLAHGAVGRQTFTGTQRSIIANRVSYLLGLRGPSMTVDTGQSSSLVAVHLACQSLRCGESTVALVGGVQLNLGWDRALALSRLGALSPDGRCFTMDERANGFVRGEGGGVMVLKPLAAAIADGDPVYCVIRGSAVNNDGGGEGLTAPDQEAQQRLLQSAYRQAGIPVGDVHYVELHGTGTPLGDRVEARALGAVLGAGRAGSDRPLVIGSAKTNVGHLEGGAGIVGLLKVALAIQHGEVPASLNFEHPSPEIPLGDLGLRVATSAEPWPEGERVVAGVSSFGIGGTNCHVVVEQPPGAQDVVAAAGPTPSGVVPWVVSGRSHGAVRDNARRLADAVATQPELEIAPDVARALITTRTAFPYRAVVLGHDREELLDGLAGLSDARPSARVIQGQVDPDLHAERPVFVFPGQGGQWPAMAVELLEHSPPFAAVIGECDEVISALADFSVRGVLRGAPDAPSMEAIEVVQPVLFAIMVSLARLWEAAGVTPAAVVGHSQGEIAAAHIAGGLSLEDAALIVVVRSRALARLAGVGGMLSAGLSLEEFEQRTKPFGGRITVAAVNALRSLVVSGDPEAIEQLAQDCETDDVPVRRIQSTVPGHSPHVEAVRDEVLGGLASITPRTAALPVISTVTGGRIDTATMDAGHWYRNLRQTVRFAPAIAHLLAEGTRTFIEIGPHPVLTVPVEAIAEQMLGESDPPSRVAVLATLRRDRGGPQQFATALAELNVRGGEVDWLTQLGPNMAPRPRLPTYTFQRERYWLDTTSPPAPGAPRPHAPPAAAVQEPEAAPPPGSAFATRVAAAGERQRPGLVLEAVLGEAAVVLGHASASDIDARLPFKELGFDSPGILELRTRVNVLTGLRLSTSALFDFATPMRLAERVVAELTGATDEAREPSAPPRTDEPIAIVGIGCRFPGGVASAEDLWDLVAAGRDATGDFPTDRGWDLARLFDPEGGPGTTYVRRGGFLYDAPEFDAEHFGISPREALSMDPHQRLLLECSWEALEDAGLDPTGLRGTQTGVFTGIYSLDYGPRMHEGEAQTAGYGLTGTLPAVVSGRVAYVLGLEGPAVSLDTACSSSLVALHLACQALRSGECTLALAGGATVMSSPGVFVDFAVQRGLSPDARCRAYGAGADGTGFAEGVGVLVLEPLSVAQARCHRVLGVIRGSAVNQDGASNGLTAPSGASQERVIRQAVANAGLVLGDVDAVEGHGTGTELGDPIEAGALLATYGRRRDGPLWLGSLKSNLGHTQAAAGVGGVIKMVMALRHEELPPTLYADEPSPHVSWDEGEVRLLSDAVAWPRGERPRRAGVSSFGISGTNAHLLLEEAPASAPVSDAPGPRPGVLPFLISGSSAPALAAQAGRLADMVEAGADLDPFAVAGALALDRGHFLHRAVAVAGNLADLTAQLRALERDEPAEGVVRPAHPARREGRVGFVFPGQGGQWAGMAVELLEQSQGFAEHMQACAGALAPHVDFDLLGVVRGEPGVPALERIEVVQPVLFAIMVSLAELWRSFGVEPDAVVGHSQGEIAAAHIAGALTLEDAARIVAVRSRELAHIAGGGGMLAVALSPEAFAERTATLDGRVTVAAVNGPMSLIVSADPQALNSLQAGLESEGVWSRRIASTVAGHSPHVEVAREAMLSSLASVAPRTGTVPLYSTVSGGLLDTATMDAEHWYRNLRQTVEFAPAVRAMAQDGVRIMIEISPHTVLTAAVADTAQAAGVDPASVRVLGTLRRDEGGLDRFVGALAEAHVAGVDVDWTALLGAGRHAHVALPTYAFQRRRYWLTARTGRLDAQELGLVPTEHPMLGAMLSLGGRDGVVWTGRLSLADHPWLADHALLGKVVVPGTAFLELALHAAVGTEAPVIEQLTGAEPLTLEEGRPVALQVRVSAADAQGRRALAIFSRAEAADEPGADWTQHASGTVVADAQPDRSWAVDWPVDGEAHDADHAYARLTEAGYDLGPAFQGLRRVVGDGDTLVAEASLDDEAARAHQFELHPALLEAGLQVAALAEAAGLPAGMPASFTGVRLRQSGAAALRVRLAPAAQGWSLLATDADGAPVVSIDAMQTRELDARGPAARHNALFALEWATPPGSADRPGPRLAVLGEASATAGLAADRYDDLAALVAAVAGGAEAPDKVLIAAAPPVGDDLLESAHLLTAHVLGLLQAWLAADVLAESRLVVLTHGAVAVTDGERPDLRQAPLTGLLRTAGSEHPGRFGMIDTDGDERSVAALATALASAEPEVALRGGEQRVPRVRPFREDGVAPIPAPQTPGTVLVTGGLTGLGALFARRLAERHGVRHLLLVSRRGPAAPGVKQLVAQLRDLGCEAEVAACDVTDRAALQRLIAAIPADRPLTAVAHAAAALDDGVLTAMDGERLRRVMTPKIDAAIHLHELTRDLPLSEFILFSSAACSLGNPGQSNYAAANAFLDALAAARRAEGLPALALAFGFWERVTELTAHLTTADGRRSAPLDMLPMADEMGLDAIDAARRADRTMLAPMRLDFGKLADRGRKGLLPPVLSALVRTRPPRAAAVALGTAGDGASDERCPDGEAIRGEIAVSLGYESPAALDMELSFVELGFDSLVSLELRRRLQALTGANLSASVMFEHPTPAALVSHLMNGAEERTATSATQVADGNGTTGTLTGMFRRAYQLRKLKDGIVIAEAAARLQPRFGMSHIERCTPAVVGLAKGDVDPVVYCIPSLVASSGPHEFARFAKAFVDRRAVVAVPAPGFAADELLPSMLDAAAGAQAAAIAQHAAGRQVALVGFSTGGLLAYAVADTLAQAGIAPAAVVLIDSYTMETIWPIVDPVVERMLNGEGTHPAIDDRTLTAMGAYHGMLTTWKSRQPVAPTLLVKASEPLPGVLRLGDWTASWSSRHAAIDLPGTHLSLLEDDAETTARAIEDWLARHPAAPRPHRPTLRTILGGRR